MLDIFLLKMFFQFGKLHIENTTIHSMGLNTHGETITPLLIDLK